MDEVDHAGQSDSIIKVAEFKSQKDLKGDGSKPSRYVGITKLVDAEDAGGSDSKDCTLILTEGDSAKSFAVSGLGVIGRKHYGVFPLRGKLLNVREADDDKIAANEEIQNIMQILGLKKGEVYDDVTSLRYGHLMIMTDQDHDGSHIKGLIINFMHSLFPSLLKIPGFMLEFITPIVKAHCEKETKVFYTIPEYKKWKEDNNTSGWKVKYYKGLGTFTNKEAQEQFLQLNQHRKEFEWKGDEDEKSIKLAFCKTRIDDRKKWLMDFIPGTYLNHSAEKISYFDFINKELILYFRADLDRSIPSMLDGLKPVQRKIMFTCFKCNLKEDIKVAQLSAYVAQHSAYHHGEQNLAGAIMNLAQDFIGSNNVNLLHPSGQFGTRLQGGKDAASARYVYTRLSKLTRHLFNEHDDVLLTYLNEEGQRIEPAWYMPILPTVLLNGAEGIGTGWSTSVLNYNPLDIVENLRHLLNGKEQVALHPWYRGFLGTIEEEVPNKSGSRSYVVGGKVSKIDSNTIEITELPVRKWTKAYKEFLDTLLQDKDKLIEGYQENHSDVKVHFVVKLLPGKLDELQKTPGALEAKFKLQTTLGTSNMMLFDQDGILKHYPSPEAIIAEFFPLRLEYYKKRHMAMLQFAKMEQKRADNKIRFIRKVLQVDYHKRLDIMHLEKQGFKRMSRTNAAIKVYNTRADGVNSDNEEEAVKTGYEYLLSMSIHSLTSEGIEALKVEAAKAAARVNYLASITASKMWKKDLYDFEKAYKAWENAENTGMEVQSAVAQSKPNATVAPPKPAADVPATMQEKPIAAVKLASGPEVGATTTHAVPHLAAAARATQRKVVVDSKDDEDLEASTSKASQEGKPPLKHQLGGKTTISRAMKPLAGSRKPNPIPTSSQGSEQPSNNNIHQPEPEAAGLAARLAGQMQTQLNLRKPCPSRGCLYDNKGSLPAQGIKAGRPPAEGRWTN